MRIDHRVVQAHWLMEIGRWLRHQYADTLEKPGPALRQLASKLRQLEAREAQAEEKKERHGLGTDAHIAFPAQN